MNRECRNCAHGYVQGCGNGSWLCPTHAKNGNPLCVPADGCCGHWRPYTESERRVEKGDVMVPVAWDLVRRVDLAEKRVADLLSEAVVTQRRLDKLEGHA